VYISEFWTSILDFEISDLGFRLMLTIVTRTIPRNTIATFRALAIVMASDASPDVPAGKKRFIPLGETMRTLRDDRAPPADTQPQRITRTSCQPSSTGWACRSDSPSMTSLA